MKEIDWFRKLPPSNRKKVLPERKALTPEEKKTMCQYGQEYFDGSSRMGYGGYYYDSRFASVVAEMIKHYGLGPDSRMLDVGCAKGFLSYEFYKAGIKHAGGIDVSEYAIANCPEEIRGNCVVGSASDLSHWTDNYFDLVISKDALHNLQGDELDRSIKEIMRVSKGGMFIQVSSYQSNEQKISLLSWAVTIKTVMSVDEWLEKFDSLQYRGDYHLVVDILK